MEEIKRYAEEQSIQSMTKYIDTGNREYLGEARAYAEIARRLEDGKRQLHIS